MQGIRCITFKKILSVVIFLTCLLGMASVYAAESAVIPPEIFIGNTPSAIKIQQGMPVELPILFAGGTLANKEVELYVFRVQQDGEYFCFGSGGWNSYYALTLEDFKPLCTVQLPKYIYLRWQAFDNTQSLSNFDLWVCVDDNIDGIPTENSIYCGHQLVVIGDNDTGTRNLSDTGTTNQPAPLSVFWHPDGAGDGGGSPSLTAPSFQMPFSVGGNVGGNCNSLGFAPEGTNFSSNSISKFLDLGSTKQVTVLATACGKPVPVSRVNVTKGEAWLSFYSYEGNKVILGLNTTGLQAGSTYTGIVKVVTTGGITGYLTVNLQVQGQCIPNSVLVPSSLSFRTSVGSNPSAQTLSVTDNCGNPISANATVSSGSDWLKVVPETGTGKFSVSCSASGLSVNSTGYQGMINLNVEGYGERYVSVTLTVESTQSSSTYNGEVTTVPPKGIYDYYNVKASEALYFKLTTDVNCDHRIQVSTTPGDLNQPRTVHILVKRGGLPMPSDLQSTQEYGSPPTYDCSSEKWNLSKPANLKDLYWPQFSRGNASGESLEIKEPTTEPTTFYIMLYNSSETEDVSNQRLIISYY